MRTQPGRLEQFHFAKVALHIDSCVVCAAEYRNSNQDVVLTRDILYPALRQVIQRHAALGVRVVYKPQSVDECSFVQLDSVDLDKHVQFISGGDLEHIMQVQLSTEFDTAAPGPLWRVLVLDANIVLFSFHHGIGDGLSGMAFHTTLLRALQSSSAESDASESVVAIPGDLELTPPIETRVDVSPPLTTILHAILGLFIPTSWTPTGSTWTGAPIGRSPTSAVHCKILHFSATELARFHSACRSNNATVTSALYVVAVAAISQAIGKTNYRTVCGAVPISLRGLSGTPPEAFGCEASVYTGYPHIDTTFSWERAREVALDFQRQKTSSKSGIGLIRYLFGNYGGFFSGHFGQKRPYTFALSNLGVFNGGDATSAWRVNEMWFGQSDAYVGAAVKLNVVGVANGGLTVCLTSGVSAVDDVVFDDIANRITELFHKVV